MKQIDEKDGLQKEWYARAKEMTLENLPEFLRELTEEHEHDYDTICYAVASAAIAAAWSVERSPQGGITGAQAGAIMWEFITNWMSEYKDKPIRLTNFENMLYPQYEDKFKTISKETADWIRKEAQKKLSNQDMHPDVLAHIKLVAEGHIPFGYSIAED